MFIFTWRTYISDFPRGCCPLSPLLFFFLNHLFYNASNHSLSYLPSSQSLSDFLFLPHPLLFQKKAGLLGLSTKHAITQYSKTRQTPSYKVWCSNSGGGDGTQEQAKESDSPNSHCYKFHKRPRQQPQCIYRGAGTDPCRLCDCLRCLWAPMSPDSMDCVLMVPFTCLAPTILFPPLPQGSSSFEGGRTQ